jgi:hypothetical protein
MPLSVERPFRAITPHVLGQRRVMFESELLTYTLDDGGRQRSIAVNTMHWRFGITETHELQLTLESFRTDNIRRAPGIGDTTLFWKKKIAGNPDHGWAWAVRGALRIPTGAETAAERRVRGELLSPLAWAWGESGALQSAWGVALGRGRDSTAMQATFIGSVGALWKPTDRFHFMADISDEYTSEGAGYNQARVMAGLGIAPVQGFRLDGGVRFGLTPASEDVGFFMGIATGIGGP